MTRPCACKDQGEACPRTGEAGVEAKVRIARHRRAVLVRSIDQALLERGVAELDGVLLHVEDDAVHDALDEDEALAVCVCEEGREVEVMPGHASG